MGRVLARARVLAALERHIDRRPIHWFVSLFAIYQIDEMVKLDTPWWSYRSIDVVDAWLRQRRDARVFEYGAGASTVWFARRAARVDSVEHDPQFAASVAALVPENAVVHVVEGAPRGPSSRRVSRKRGHTHLDFGDYVDQIRQVEGPFDLIAIDGRSRVACLVEAQRHLAPGGIIVFDNAGRAEYRDALEGLPLTVRKYRGLTPTLPYLNTTAVVFG